MLKQHSKALALAVLAGWLGGALLSSEASAQARPRAGEDITGKTVYLEPGARLRFQASLLGRVYTRSTVALQVVGRGKCSLLACPVTHNNVELWGRRLVMLADRPAGPIQTDRTLRRGDEGNDVLVLQNALIKLGHTLTADSKFGRGTEAAVKDFQQKNGLTADGVVGPVTRDKLRI
jgi:hypothetical protein